MDKYVQNLISAGASPHLIAKLSTFPPTPVAPPPPTVPEPEQDETHGNAPEPAPAPRRGRKPRGGN